MEKDYCNKNQNLEKLSPLRTRVTSIVSETLENGGMFCESGIRIKGEIEMFIQRNRNLLPDFLPVGSNFRLNSETVMFERVEQVTTGVPSSLPGGWFELKPHQVVNLAVDLIQDQKKLYGKWFSYSGLILNSIEHNLRIEKKKNTFF